MVSRLFSIKKLGNLFVNPLTIFFNELLRIGYFPCVWGNPYISPVYKKGSRHVIGNYRPITKVSLFPKIFDKLGADKLYEFFSGLIVREQGLENMVSCPGGLPYQI